MSLFIFPIDVTVGVDEINESEGRVSNCSFSV
jgi:hypothetical protein